MPRTEHPFGEEETKTMVSKTTQNSPTAKLELALTYSEDGANETARGLVREAIEQLKASRQKTQPQKKRYLLCFSEGFANDPEPVVVNFLHFHDDNGYEKDEIEQIAELEVGEMTEIIGVTTRLCVVRLKAGGETTTCDSCPHDKHEATFMGKCNADGCDCEGG